MKQNKKTNLIEITHYILTYFTLWFGQR